MAGYVDLRKLNNEELFKLRKSIVRLKGKGLSGKEIERLLSVRQNRVSEVWRRYLNGGVEALKPGMAGRKAGEKSILNEALAREIRLRMIDKRPDDLGMPYSLWTCRIACDYIRREYDVKLTGRSMTNYLKRWGFISKAPLMDEGSLESEAFKVFIKEEFPAIVRRAGAENVGIYWFCETVIEREYRKSDKTGAQSSKGRVHISKLRARSSKGRARNVNMAAAVTARGTARFTFFEGRMSQEKFVTLMSRLIRYADRKVFFIAADKKALRGESVRAWLKSRKDVIEVFYHPE